MKENKCIYKIYHGDEYIASFVYLRNALDFINTMEYTEPYWRYTIAKIKLDSNID